MNPPEEPTHKIKSLSFADLKEIQLFAYEMSVDFEMRDQYKYWSSMQNLCEAEIKERITNVFGEP